MEQDPFFAPSDSEVNGDNGTGSNKGKEKVVYSDTDSGEKVDGKIGDWNSDDDVQGGGAGEAAVSENDNEREVFDWDFDQPPHEYVHESEDELIGFTRLEPQPSDDEEGEEEVQQSGEGQNGEGQNSEGQSGDGQSVEGQNDLPTDENNMQVCDFYQVLFF